MKGLFKYLVLIIICMFPFVVKAQEENKVTITNVELDSKSETVVVGEPTIDGVSIKFDLKFKEVNQYAKYKVTLKNDDTEDYELVSDKDTETSTYITYEYTITGESVIKAGEEKIVYVTATYTTEVPASKLDDAGMYKESNASSIELVSGSLEVPDTLKNISIVGIALILILIVGALIIIRTNKKASVMMIMMALLLVPFTVSALKQVKINVTAVVKINPGPSKFCIASSNLPPDLNLNVIVRENYQSIMNKFAYVTYNEGDTFEDNSFNPSRFYTNEELACYKLDVDNMEECLEEVADPTLKECVNSLTHPGDGATDEELDNYYDSLDECNRNYQEQFFTEILDASYGCYYQVWK